MFAEASILHLIYNLIFAGLVKHVEFMEHGEPIVKSDFTGW